MLFRSGGRSPDLWFNLDALVPPQPGFRGTAGRNIVNGPTLKTLDFSVVKIFRINERFNLQFRAEAFNLFNRPNFDLPSNAQDGEQVFSTLAAPGANDPCIAGTRTPELCFARTGSAGKIFNTVSDSREIQFALKLVF